MVTLSGKGLMSGQASTLTINKTTEGGIVFSNNGIKVPALATNILSTSNFVVLGNQEAQFALIEHLMASLAFCNVKNALRTINDFTVFKFCFQIDYITDITVEELFTKLHSIKNKNWKCFNSKGYICI